MLFSGETKISDEKRTALASAFVFLNTFLEGNKWVCGNEVTIADLAILASLASIYVSEFNICRNDYKHSCMNFNQTPVTRLSVLYN